MMKDTKTLQEDLYETLASYAVKKTIGRFFKETEHKGRLPFQLDRDRVIHCKSFRRLSEKTQVFTANYGDHYRTRLTHTMEVAQISRDIARTFSLNEDLAEAIALAHDLGHAPFGHAGEDALNEVMKDFDLHFEHNEQSRRVVEKLETIYPNFAGLNLTKEVLEGLIKHKTSWDHPEIKNNFSPHLEAQVVNFADEIAYTNHDIDDGLRSGLFDLEDLGKIELWQMAKKFVCEKYGGVGEETEHYRGVSALIHLMIRDLLEKTEENLQRLGIKSLADVQKCEEEIVVFGNDMKMKIAKMRDFLSERFYFTDKVQEKLKLGRKIIKELFEFYYENFTKLPAKLKNTNEAKEIVIKDYIAGMTDGFAEKEYERLVK